MKITGSGKIETAPVRRKNAARSGDGARFTIDPSGDVTETCPFTGALLQRKLRRLLAPSSVKRKGFIDPRLNLIFSDIELRAKLELAKLEISKILF